MEPMYLQVLQKETGRQIKKLLVENGYTMKDVQNAMGFENPQAVYKWISGRSLPSLDNEYFCFQGKEIKEGQGKRT